MGRLSRGCLRCRQRRVRCDEGRPSCQRCIHRNEICEGYRDESTLIFRHETDKVVEHSRRANAQQQQIISPSPSLHSSSSSSPHSLSRSKSVGGGSSVSRRSSPYYSSSSIEGPDGKNLILLPELPPEATTPINSRLRNGNYPWLKASAAQSQPHMDTEDQVVVDQFLDKYVMYPCNQTSTPGFLEHLPSMFKEVNIIGRVALRSAVLAASFAGVLKDDKGGDDDALAKQALQHYGRALNALGESLSSSGKVPDDYDLMTVVILDIFETLYIPDQVKRGSHVHGMAGILRLQGADLVYSPRGWSLFRLAHHRIQKQQLAFQATTHFTDSSEWLDQLNDSEPYVRLEKNASEIGETCKRARELLATINGGQQLPISSLVDMIQELHSLDREAVSWRQKSQWDFTTLHVSERERPDLLPATGGVTDTIQLFSDVWIAYEWNYHRTARIIFLQQLLVCSQAALEAAPDLGGGSGMAATATGVDDDGIGYVDYGGLEEQILRDTMTESTSTIRWLADQVFATVPQSFGDVNHMGRAHHDNDSSNSNSSSGGGGGESPPQCRAIGSYLLLWPIRVIGSPQSATSHEQKERAARVYERIREYTGMRDLLGAKSNVVLE